MAHFLFNMAYGLGTAMLALMIFLAVGWLFQWIFKHFDLEDLFNGRANWER